MNNIQLKQFEDRLKKLDKFTHGSRASYKESEIIDWISDCINLFYEIGVDSVIIRNFLEHFDSKVKDVEYERRDITLDLGINRKGVESVKTIGPFQEEIHFPFLYGARIQRTGNYVLVGNFYYVNIAFSSARSVLRNKISEKRIVPFWLTEQTVKADNLKHISSSLELIENKYEQEDAHGLVTESVTLLDSVLNFDSELKKKDLGGKLNSLIENKDKLDSFGVTKDLVIGLNCGRLLRNTKIIHKNIPSKYEFSFLIATNFAYLVLFFVECAILNEKVLSKDKE